MQPAASLSIASVEKRFARRTCANPYSKHGKGLGIVHARPRRLAPFNERISEMEQGGGGAVADAAILGIAGEPHPASRPERLGGPRWAAAKSR